MWHQPSTLVILVILVLFDCKFAINTRNHKVSTLWRDRTVYHNNVSIMYPCITHAISRYTSIKSTFRMAHHLPGQINRIPCIILCWTWKACTKSLYYHSIIRHNNKWYQFKITSSKMGIGNRPSMVYTISDR